MSIEHFTHDVFLSHSAQDKAVVRPLSERLRADGLKVGYPEGAMPKADGGRSSVERVKSPKNLIKNANPS